MTQEKHICVIWKSQNLRIIKYNLEYASYSTDKMKVSVCFHQGALERQVIT